MDPSPFLGLEPTHNPRRWILPITPPICTAFDFLFGGCGLGAAIEALERTSGRPVIWATAQYLAYAKPGTVLDIDVSIPIEGKSVTQARAIGKVGEEEILAVSAALGTREELEVATFTDFPDVLAPEDCPLRPTVIRPTVDSLFNHMDMRLAKGRQLDQFDGVPFADGRSALWARIEEMPETSAAKLAILGDYVPFGTSQAIGKALGGNSLDNTLRVVRPVESEWVLIDVQVHALARGFGHGLVHLWSEDGQLMATASQSTIMRAWAAPLPSEQPG